MKTKKSLFIISIIFILSVSSPCSAGAHSSGFSIDADFGVFENGSDDGHVVNHGLSHDTIVIKILYENAPRFFNAPSMPRFAIIGKDEMFYIGIGGYLKGTLLYDIGNPVSNPSYFEPSSIPVDQKSGNEGSVQINAGTSNIYLNFIALPKSKNRVGTYINFNFSGKNYAPTLQNAYIKYRGFTFGYGVSLFTDVSAGVPTIDAQGPNAMSFVRTSLLDYRYEINRHWSVGIGLELPSLNATYGIKSYPVNQRVPDIPIVAKYTFGNNLGWVRFASVLRNLYYRNEVCNETKDVFGWAVQLSGAFTSICNSKVKLFYQGIYGDGAASYIQDMQGLGLDIVPVSDGKLQTTEEWGAYVGTQCQICPNILCSFTYSYVNSYLPDKQQGFVSPLPATTYKWAQYIVTNCFYSISDVITCGIEYIYGSRSSINGTYKQDNRIQTALRINF